jgi:hypothetical protein
LIFWMSSWNYDSSSSFRWYSFKRFWRTAQYNILSMITRFWSS